jgi:hypothetical protein
VTGDHSFNAVTNPMNEPQSSLPVMHIMRSPP